MKKKNTNSNRFFMAGLVIGALAFPITFASLLGADNIVESLKSYVASISLQLG